MRNRPWSLLALASLVALALPAWAAHTEKATLSLDQTATIGTMKLAPGTYQLEAVPGSSQLVILRNGERLGTQPCHWFRLHTKPSQTEVFLTRNRVQQVRFSGKLMAVRVGGAATAKG
ncbi:MAG TPA: hypothetical protein VE996_05585 [Terriglobales bacterium]|jgi:hypothetical protein|nr:hypothetical protein [Terriglobales bacterium]